MKCLQMGVLMFVSAWEAKHLASPLVASGQLQLTRDAPIPQLVRLSESIACS